MEKINDVWLDTDEAAAYLDLPVNHLHGMRDEGVGPLWFMMGTKVLYKEGDLLRWLAVRFR